MNIFFLDESPKKCASAHANQHVNAMLTQMTKALALAYYMPQGFPYLSESDLDSFPREAGFYPFNEKNYNDPMNEWLRSSMANWKWVHRVCRALVSEWYNMTRGKRHSCHTILLWMNAHKPVLAKDNFTLPPMQFGAYKDFLTPNNTPTTFNEIINLYRYYYVLAKPNASWLSRTKPEWVDYYKKLVKNVDFNF